MPVTRLWWVRHGPTHERRMTGWRDVPADLTDGAAISRLAAHLPPGAVVASSDLLRARQTAQAIAFGRRMLPPDAGLREINFGTWDGRDWADIAATDPDLSRAFWEAPGHHRAPEGESWDEAAARVSATADALVAAHRGGDLIVVSHFGAILTQLARARRCTPAAVLAQRIEPLSVTRLERHPDGWHEGSANHQP